jgi:hypothetical protein
MTADYNKFPLILSDEHKALPPDEFVYNHKGELLYWFNINPADIPIFTYNRLMDSNKNRAEHRWHGTLWEHGQHATFIGPGLDSDGVPCFSHFTQERVSDPYYNLDEIEPLTVATVRHWFGWFLLNLNNSYLQKKVTTPPQP